MHVGVHRFCRNKRESAKERTNRFTVKGDGSGFCIRERERGGEGGGRKREIGREKAGTMVSVALTEEKLRLLWKEAGLKPESSRLGE